MDAATRRAFRRMPRPAWNEDFQLRAPDEDTSSQDHSVGTGSCSRSSSFGSASSRCDRTPQTPEELPPPVITVSSAMVNDMWRPPAHGRPWDTQWVRDEAEQFVDPPLSACDTGPATGPPTLAPLLHAGLGRVHALLFAALGNLIALGRCSRRLRELTEPWAASERETVIASTLEPGTGCAAVAAELQRALVRFRARFRLSAVGELAVLLHLRADARVLGFDVDHAPLQRGPPLPHTPLFVAAETTRKSTHAAPVGLDYGPTLAWLEEHELAALYPRGPSPFIAAMLEAVAARGLAAPLLVLDLCPLRQEWVPALAAAAQAFRSIVFVPEPWGPLDEGEARELKRKFTGYLRRLRGLGVTVSLLLAAEDARLLQSVLECRVHCVPRLPPRLGPVGHKQHDAREILQIIATLGIDESGHENRSSLLQSDATGRACFLAPEAAPDAPALLVTDTTSAIPALVVTDFETPSLDAYFTQR
eukprot:TRINITY_DN10440_c0_g1_i1.p1 TRINITY_DN10440_c0_g1~~TRINITY_DN10440_c0_g1_i1.p1  ORF type:complete len:476 (+),score=87.42 TRINITY_DN10440_c0_g1_i1:74-1501(+)